MFGFRKVRKGTLPRRFITYRVVLILSVCLFALIVIHKLTNSPVQERSSFQDNTQRWSSDDVDSTNNSENITEVLDEQRQLISDEMCSYRYPAGRFKVSARTLDGLVPETGGQPILNIVITTWRSGSTFLGDILNSHPANFYHYEPLLDYGNFRIRDEPLAREALKVLRSLLNCDYSGLDHYLAYGRKHTDLFGQNTRLWEHCQQHPLLCWRPEFLTPFCRLFPFQSMKIVRLRLRLVEEFLDDDSLNLRVVYLVRDPRGTLRSRKSREWCINPDCIDPGRLCSDLADDYEAASKLAAKFPNRFRAVRYEDLSVAPHKTVKELLNFLGLNFHRNVQIFLDTHTKSNTGGDASTYRISELAPFHWRRGLEHSEVLAMQKTCWRAMGAWGYVQTYNSSHQRKFNPVGEYELMDLRAMGPRS